MSKHSREHACWYLLARDLLVGDGDHCCAVHAYARDYEAPPVAYYPHQTLTSAFSFLLPENETSYIPALHEHSRALCVHECHPRRSHTALESSHKHLNLSLSEENRSLLGRFDGDIAHPEGSQTTGGHIQQEEIREAGEDHRQNGERLCTGNAVANTNEYYSQI